MMRCCVMVLTPCLLLAMGAFATTENIIADFNYSNGAFPAGPVMLDSAGNVYGVTPLGGTNGFGTVYQLVNSGGTWTLNTLYNFTGGTSDVCGANFTGLVMDSSGHLYGTAPGCGAYTRGGVFKLTQKNGTWTEKLLYSFRDQSDGAYPNAGLAIDSKGVLYISNTD